MAIKKIPCGGFYVDDGAVQNVDGKPVLSAWNADLPKPSVGGYGYTEQGDQVLFDGDLLINTPVSQSGTVGNIIDIDQLEVGETYKVVWNGVEYICECVGGEVTYIGNPSIIGAHVETDEPFAFVVDEGEVLVLTSTAGTYSIKLSKSGETIHKIDEKYLPEAGGAMVVNFDYDGTTDSYVADKSFAEILSAYPNVYGSHYGGEEIYYVQGNDGDDSINFVTFIATDTALYINQWTVYADDSVEHIDREIRFSQS